MDSTPQCFSEGFRMEGLESLELRFGFWFVGVLGLRFCRCFNGP